MPQELSKQLRDGFRRVFDRLRGHQRKAAKRMHRVDSCRVPENPREIRLFAVVRNEQLRLPFFLRYYTNLGVDRFFFLDNDSTDDTPEILRGADNVHVFHTKETFRNKAAWTNGLMSRYGMGHWCIVADADELLVYPYMEKLTLEQFTRFFDQEGLTAVHAVLLDLYPNGHTGEATYEAGADPVKTASYFDPPAFDVVPYEHTHSETPVDYVLGGGVRKRAFGIDACCSKIPLVKYTKSTFVRDGHHSIEGGRMSEMQIAVLHTMFLQDFTKKASRESARGEQHWADGALYKAYASALAARGDVDLRNNDSIQYEGTQQLLDMGLMHTTDAFDAFARRNTIDTGR